MFLLGFVVIMFVQDGELPVFVYQPYGSGDRIEGQLDFGVRLGDRMESPESQPVKKKKGRILARFKMGKHNAQQEKERVALNHGLRIVSLGNAPRSHPWIKMFPKLEAGLDSDNRIRLLRASLFTGEARNGYLSKERTKKLRISLDKAFKEAKYPKIVSNYGQFVSEHLRNKFPYSESAWLDPMNRLIVIGFTLKASGKHGVFVEVSNGSAVAEEIKPELKRVEKKKEKKAALMAEYISEYERATLHKKNLSIEFYFSIENGASFTWLKEKLGAPYTSHSSGNETVFVWRKVVGYDLSQQSNYSGPQYGYLNVLVGRNGKVTGKSQEGLR